MMTTDATTADHPRTEEEQELSFRRISALNVCDICELSETLADAQRDFVADNGTSIAEGFCSEAAWFRAVYLGDEPVGFVMTHTGSDWDDGIECHGVYLWRMMIAGPYQGQGLGRRVIAHIAEATRAAGYAELFTSFGEGEDGPERFYTKLGFVRTGDFFDDEPEAVLDLDAFLAASRTAGA